MGRKRTQENTLWLETDAVLWNRGILCVKTPYGNHEILCTGDEAPVHVKRIIKGIAREHGYGTICLDMTGPIK